MSYKRTKTGRNSYSTFNTRTGVSTSSYSTGSKSLRVTQTNRSDGKSYTTTTYNNGGWITRERKSNSSPQVRIRNTKYRPMNYKYTPQLFLISIIVIALGYVLEKLGF